MKKAAAIFLLFLSMIALLHISVATHFCGGTEVARKVSLDGKLATCGMECSEDQIPANGVNLTNHCCDNVITYCGTDNNYIPSFNLITEYYQIHIPDFMFTAEETGYLRTALIHQPADIGPPGKVNTSGVDLSDISVLRI